MKKHKETTTEQSVVDTQRRQMLKATIFQGMGSMRLGFTGGVILLVLLASSASSLAQTPQLCKQINARLMTVAVDPLVFWCTSPIDFCAEGTIAGDGLIQGTTQAVVLGLYAFPPAFEPATTLSFIGDRLIQTKQGDLVLRFMGAFDSARGEFSELSRVVSGTGKFAGATGTLYLTGYSQSNNTEFFGDATGVICHAPNNR